MHPESVLLLTLDSCRFDTFAAATVPNLRSVGPLHQAWAPSYFTYASHAAMFVGFTPSLPGAGPWLDAKRSKVFKLARAGFPSSANDAFVLSGASIVTGFRALGYRCLGSGAAGWFDPATAPGQLLTRDFDEFYFAGDTWSVRRQLAWLRPRLAQLVDRPVFVFLNVGETHVPYYFEGAPWDRADNPCVPFQRVDRSEDCRTRQRACLEHLDEMLAELVSAFQPATTVVCSDHGDCWGEDELWEHGISHPATLSVPLLMRVRGVPVGENVPTHA